MPQTDSSQKVKLDDLPESANKDFWGDADIHICEPIYANTKGPHYFERISGHQAQCKHCDWGFYLDPGDIVKDGHVYGNDGSLVI